MKRRRDVCRDGERNFSWDEVAAVRARANTINAQAPARTSADRELVLKIATLWEDGELPEDAIQQVLESFARARESGKRIRNPMAWLWTTFRQQCWRYSIRPEALLASTAFPHELLAPPAERKVGQQEMRT